MKAIKIVGGGPAGSAAAIAALDGGASVRIVEKSRTPQHKVCGEFLAAETCRVLEELGAWDGTKEMDTVESIEAMPRQFQAVEMVSSPDSPDG